MSNAYAAEYAPELMTEVEGVAEGAGLTVDQVMLVNVRNQVPARPSTGLAPGWLSNPNARNQKQAWPDRTGITTPPWIRSPSS